MGYTLRQAAELAEVSPTTIHRSLKSGRLSGTKAEDGAWSIDPSELARVFPKSVTGNSQSNTQEHQQNAGGTSAEVLAVKVEMLQQQLDRERDTVEDLRRRLDKAEDRVLALTMENRAGSEKEQDRRGWWAKLMGR